MHKDKRIMFLGSSVTYGTASNGTAMAEILAEKYGYICIKEAVPGTTLVDDGELSYVKRMQKAEYRKTEIDLFICQLSTNDATRNMPLGSVTAKDNRKSFDTSVVAGAIEYIISYVKETWGCPTVFYTGTRYESTSYANMVDLLYKIKDKWNIGIIDLWNDEEMNSVAKTEYARFMQDPIHPTEAGYREWWIPKFEKYLSEYFKA